MKRGWLLFLLLFMLSCKDKKNTLPDDKPADATDFFSLFAPIKLPYHTADTSLDGKGDTASISAAVLQKFIPDSVLTFPSAKKNAPPVFHPVGKIETKNEVYLLMTTVAAKKTMLSAFLFDDKKHYISHLTLIDDRSGDGYVHSIDINTEPTFTITKDKTVNNEYVYSRKGYAFSQQSNSFIEVINDGNDNDKKNNAIINPIDTLAKTFKYSGDYSKDKTNFISVRDGNTPKTYGFFLHFEKSKGECTGELKGTLSMVNATEAVFQQSGDPCVIDFTFITNGIRVKERGSCGNHRGITCMFDDTYKKKSPQPAKGKKASKS